MARLDRQRPPLKAHKRRSHWRDNRGYDATPHEVWGTSVGTVNPTSTILFARAGTPGTYEWSGPAGAAPNLAGLTGVTPVPSTVWTTGQSVPLTAAGSAHWNGTAWTNGVKP